MTDREKAIVMAHTGICMLEGKKLDVFYQYLDELYDRPVYTHELGTLDIKEKSKLDFLKLCEEEQPETCENAVSRNAAIDALMEILDRPNHAEFLYTDEICKALNELPFVTPKQRWIPCAERLPEEGHDVLITKEPFKIKGYEQKVIKAKRSADPRSGKIEWWSEFGALTNKAVLAWMPLPEPYREEGEQKWRG